jgi:HEAT repeat protein
MGLVLVFILLGIVLLIRVERGSKVGIFSRKPNIEKLKTEKNVEGLVKALEHKDPLVRSEAIYALGELGDRRALEPLIAVLRS